VESRCRRYIRICAGSLDPNNPNDVLLYTFALSAPSTLTIQSYGYGGSGNAPGGRNAAGSVIVAGGFDSYVSLFDGMGDAAAFLKSNDDGICPPGTAFPACHDSTLVINALAAGSYTMALSVFDNFSFAPRISEAARSGMVLSAWGTTMIPGAGQFELRTTQ
jgi:hypothetical protein